MDVTLRKPSELGQSERQAWCEFVAADPALASPYFALEFAECCEEARSDTRVIVVREKGQIVGFLPLQTGHFGYARPLGGPLGDVHGIVGEPGRDADLHAWLRAAHIGVFEFHGALASQSAFRPDTEARDGSWIVDVSDGFEAWRAQRRSVDSKAMRNVDTRYKRLERVEGGHHFVMADTRPQALDLMIAWKRDQYRQTGVFDVFSVAWTRRLLQAVLRRDGERFFGLCSTLIINDEIAAVHVGMATDRMCHFWFPAYNHDYSRMSPGVVLLVETARTAAAMGQHGVELGPGQFAFKKDLSSYQVGLACGCATTPSLMGTLCRRSVAFEHAVSKAPIGRVAGWPGKALRKIDRLAGFYAA